MDFWSVHLGTTSPTISPSSVIADFSDPFYPEYAIGFWDPEPFVVNPDFSVSATRASVSFAAPSRCPLSLQTSGLPIPTQMGKNNCLSFCGGAWSIAAWTGRTGFRREFRLFRFQQFSLIGIP